MEALSELLDLPLEALIAAVLAAVGSLLLLISSLLGRPHRSDISTAEPHPVQPPTTRVAVSEDGDAIIHRNPGQIAAVAEFFAPVSLPALVWWTLRELTSATTIPAIAGLLTFILARRAVRWMFDLPYALRARRIDRGVGDMLEMMAMCAEAGLGIDQLLHRVQRGLYDLHPELGGELARLHHLLTLLPHRATAYNEIAASTPSNSLSEVVQLLERAERTGTQLGPMLAMLIQEVALRQERHAEAVAQKIPVYLVLVLVLLFLPSVMLILVGPAYARLIDVLRSAATTPWTP